MQVLFTPLPDDDTAAAIAAALVHMLDQDQQRDAPVPPRSTWSRAAMLAAQGLPPTRRVAGTTWATAERAAREGRWSYGITGI